MAAGINRIAVEGFKSIAKRQEIEIAPLTILAGANSSGKSSIMQPLLMLKQTLEAPYDPGPLLIDGSNLAFTRVEEFLSRINGTYHPFLKAEVSTENVGLSITFVKRAGLEIQEETYILPGENVTLRPRMSSEELRTLLVNHWAGPADLLAVDRYRSFLIPKYDGSPPTSILYPELGIEDVIYVPGLRGNPARTYPVAAVGPSFPGKFSNYVASLILQWQKDTPEKPEQLIEDLQHTGLARLLVARRVSDVAIQLHVALDDNPRRADDIADVGFGVSQILPVLVALRAADPGRLVYLEEPEIHLHPRAQTKLADILAGAAKRGVRVVAETHSTLLLTAIQTLVAKGELSPDLVKLHWFQRDPKTGVTQVSSANLDENGAFGDWPEDFDEVALDAEGAYLDAVEGRKVP